jgi:hypothetical protein
MEVVILSAAKNLASGWSFLVILSAAKNLASGCSDYWKKILRFAQDDRVP